MIGEHYEDWELLAFDDRNAEMVDVAAAATHVAWCGECQQNLSSLHSLAAMLADRDVHEFAAVPRRKPDPRRIAAAQALVRRADEERRVAAQTFEDLMAMPLDDWSAYLESRPDKRTEALIDRIIVEAREDYDRCPEHALSLLAVAVGIANTLKDMFGLAQQRGTIAKERANALRMLSRYSEALDELDWAEKFINHLPIRAFDLALVEWGRATVLFYMTRYAEALPLVRHASKILEQFGDIPRAQQAGLLEAGILFETGDVASALRMNRRLAVYFEQTADVGTLARVVANMAACEALLDHHEEAHLQAARAMELYDKLGKPTERIRLDSTLGNLCMRQGRFDEAHQKLRAAAVAFEALGMKSEAGQALLDIVEMHIARKEWDSAIPLARNLAGLFTGAGTPVHAARAYGFLREAVETRSASVDLVDYIRSYVLREGRTAFVPPR